MEGKLNKPRNKNILAAKVRQEFHRRELRGITVGDLVETPEGNVGMFQGISNSETPYKIAITLYYIKPDDPRLEEQEAQILPQAAYFEGQEVRLSYGISGKPKED
jgi:hypothetical protein